MLRALVRETSSGLHAMRASGKTPLAEYEAKRCDACSLIDLCQPKALRFRKGARDWFERHLAPSDFTDSEPDEGHES